MANAFSDIVGSNTVVTDSTLEDTPTLTSDSGLDTGWQKVTGKSYSWYDEYTDDDYSTVNSLKTVNVSANQINLTQEQNSQVIPFEMDRRYDGIDLTTMDINIHYVNADGQEAISPVINVIYNDSKIRFYWLIDSLVTYKAGNIQFEIIATGTTDAGSYTWKTRPNTTGINVIQSIVGTNGTITPTGGWDTYITTITSRATEAQTAANTANAAAEDAQEALASVREEIDNLSETVTSNVKSAVIEEITPDYYTKTEVDTKFDEFDISDQLTEVQNAIIAKHSVDTLRGRYVSTETDGVWKLTLYDMHDDVENVLFETDVDVNPTSTWSSNFASSINSSVATAISNAVTPVSEAVDKNTSDIATNTSAISGIQTDLSTNYSKTSDIDSLLANKADASTVSALSSEVDVVKSDVATHTSDISTVNETLSSLQETVNDLVSNNDQLYTYDVTYTPAEGEETPSIFTLYEIEHEGDEDEVRTAKKSFVIQGGAGGSGGSTSTMSIERVTASPVTVIDGNNITLQYKYSSIDGDGDTVDGTATWKIGNRVIKTTSVVQGVNSFDVTDYCTVGTQKMVLSITDENGTTATKTWTVQVVDLSISSTFNDQITYSDSVTFSYTPIGAVEKTVHIKLDGTEVYSQTTTVTNIPQSYTISKQAHGSHLLDAYITATINGEEKTTDHILKDIIWLDSSSTVPVIGCAQTTYDVKQYDSVNISYVVFDPSTETPDVDIIVDGDETTKTSLTLTSNANTYVFKSSVVGTHTVTIRCGETTKEITVNVAELGIDVTPITANLAFDFNPTGYSNTSANRLWSSGSVAMTVSDNFDWTNGGYQIDDDGNQYFNVKAGTRAYISYDMFDIDESGSDPKRYGREFKIIYEIENVRKIDTVAVSCIDGSNNVGFQIQPHAAYITSTAGTLYDPLSEEDIIEFEFNLEKASTSGNKSMVMCYEDGCPGRLMLHDDSHSFVHSNHTPITIGSDDCDIRIYRMKEYNSELTDSNILSNFIADARTADEMISRYNRNQIYNDSGALTPQSVSEALPDIRVVVISAPYFTNDKDDKVKNTNITCYYPNGLDYATDNWTATGAIHRGQGTSSNWYGLAGRNLDLDMKKATILDSNGDAMTGVTLGSNSIPANYLNIKVNIASSENANNALLAKRYQRFLPYETAAHERDDRAKNTLEFYNCVVFIQETNEDLTTHREFADTNIHFYGIGNIGDSKKTDSTRVSDSSDANEFVVEITDYDVPLAEFPTGDDGLTTLAAETYDDTQSYDIRYGCKPCDAVDAGVDDEGNTIVDEQGRYFESIEDRDQFYANIEVWENFYKFITRDLTTDGVEDADKVSAWKQEFADWFILDSALYFYLFTLYNTMVDNRGKNTFWHYGKDTDGKYRFEFWGYDFDTALGILKMVPSIKNLF